MKAYLRMDPLIAVRKAHYTDGQFRAYIETLTLAVLQKERGHFLSLAQLRALLGRRGKHVAFLLSQGDISEKRAGVVYVEGWNEWQEGDLTVAQRMAAMRNRRRNGPVTNAVTSDAS